MEKCVTTNIPQVSTTSGNLTVDSDRVQAPVVDACPADFEGDKSHNNGENKEKIQIEAITKNSKTPTMNPFNRSSCIKRSPPTAKTSLHAAPTETVRKVPGGTVLPTEQRIKRKRIETSPDTSKTSEKGVLIQKQILQIISEIKSLDKVVRESYNAKKEIKDISSRLSIKAELLQSGDLIQYLEVNKDTGNKDARIQEQEAEIARLRQCIEKKELEVANGSSESQCEECHKVQESNAIKRAAKGDGSLDAFKKVENAVWERKLFTNFKTEAIHITDAPADSIIILPCNTSINSEFKNIREAIKTLGGREGLIKQNKKKGEVARMCLSVGFPNSNGDYEQTTREVYYPLIKEETESQEETDVDRIFCAFDTVANEIIKRNIFKVAIPNIDGETGEILKRVCGFIFSETKVKVTLYTEKPKSRSQPMTDEKKESSETNKNKKTRTGEPKPETILVKISGKSYAETLRLVKQTVNPSEIGVDIKGIRKTKKDEVLVTIKSGTDKSASLKREIDRKLPAATTVLLVKKRILHIRDMDETSTVEEVKDAICKSISISPDKIDLRALRPAYGGRQHITAVMAEYDALKLLELGKIKIGWVMCRILERVLETKCYKCWKYGHTKHQCNGPAREHLCLKCGQEGHKAISCKNEPYCLHCNKEGHSSGHIKCPNNKSEKQRTINLPDVK